MVITFGEKVSSRLNQSSRKSRFRFGVSDFCKGIRLTFTFFTFFIQYNVALSGYFDFVKSCSENKTVYNIFHI